MTFGEKFKPKRNRLGLTQQETADKLRLNRRMITRYENGISYPRSRDAYKNIAGFFGVDVNYLLSEDQEPTFVTAELYGSRGMEQAQKFIDGLASLFAGDTLSEQDKHTVMKALQDVSGNQK